MGVAGSWLVAVVGPLVGPGGEVGIWLATYSYTNFNFNAPWSLSVLMSGGADGRESVGIFFEILSPIVQKS